MQKEGHEIEPSLRLCCVSRPSAGYCGFHLTRTAWDPYPWVSKVESGSAAEAAGLQAGDCVLEVNGEDVLGQRVREVATRVRARADRVTLLLWNAGSDPHTAASYVSLES
jgi:C-terminal processing protease CtpA/Prc